MVINTVLSVMAYDYPSEKLSVYLSDDGGSNLTFYALLEASHFARQWIPYCKKFKVEPRSPAAYFGSIYSQQHHSDKINEEFEVIKVRALEILFSFGETTSRSHPTLDMVTISACTSWLVLVQENLTW